MEGMEHMENTEHFSMANATAILPNGTLLLSSLHTPLVPHTYFTYPDYSGLMIAHIVLMTVGWLFVLPIGMSPFPFCSRIIALIWGTIRCNVEHSAIATCTLYTACLSLRQRNRACRRNNLQRSDP